MLVVVLKRINIPTVIFTEILETSQLFTFYSFNLVLLLFCIFYISFRRLYAPLRQMDTLKIFDESAFVSCCWITPKFSEAKNSLLKYVWCSYWTYFKETFHINRTCQLPTRTTVSGIFFQYSQKYSGSSAELIRFHCSLGFNIYIAV